jgi:hypothetical protein
MSETEKGRWTDGWMVRGMYVWTESMGFLVWRVTDGSDCQVGVSVQCLELRAVPMGTLGLGAEFSDTVLAVYSWAKDESMDD